MQLFLSFDRVRTRYLELARAAPGRFRIIDATQPLEQVSAAAIAALEDALGLQPLALS